MRHKLSQLPLRRLYFLQFAWHMRALIVALMYFEDGYLQAQIAKYLGVSLATVNRYLHMYPDCQYDVEDYLIARQAIDKMRGPLYATPW